MPDLVLDYHRLKTPIDHPDLSVTRAKLEYPTVDVSFAYLAAIEKLDYFATGWAQDYWIVTKDAFTDKAVEGIISSHSGFPSTRHSLISKSKAEGNFYWAEITVPYTTRDFLLFKRYAGGSYLLGYEAVDLDTGRTDYGKLSSSGSTHKAYRNDPATPKVTATDTALASGYAGFGYCAYYASTENAIDSWFARLVAPSSPSVTAVVIIETDIEGSGKPEDPFRPLFSKSLVEITTPPSLAGLPDFLYREARRYEVLRSKGFADEEMRLVFGSIPQHQVDLDAVTWGAFEFSERSSANIIVVTGDNPYKSGAVQRQADYAKKKGLRVFNPPRNYGEAVALYNKLKSDFPHWLAGKDNFAYMCLGWEELDVLQNVDFYYGELLEHRTHYEQLRRVDPKEIESRLLELKARLEKMTVLPEERDKHLKKVDELLRKGW